jgi:SAM-dependent methyltransferase
VPDPQFRTDLFRGAGRDYDRFRVPYPSSLIDDLAQRCGASGQGRLLDLACGTGQLSFALASRFAEVWAVDQEPDMISVASQRAAAIGAGLADLRLEACAAEDLSAPAAHFDLVAIGNAFHRLRREAVAASALRWLRPGGFLALVWGESPWTGDAPWQQALAATMRRWRLRLEAADGSRIPPGYDSARRATPDLDVLSAAGFELAGSLSFAEAHDWTPDALVGFLLSTSVLSRQALGALAPDFEQDLRQELRGHASAGELHQVIDFGYDLARRPA